MSSYTTPRPRETPRPRINLTDAPLAKTAPPPAKTTPPPATSNYGPGRGGVKKPELPLFSTDGETDSPSKRAAIHQNREKWARVRKQARLRFAAVAAALAKQLPL